MQLATSSLEEVAQHSRSFTDIVGVDVKRKGENEIPNSDQLVP